MKHLKLKLFSCVVVAAFVSLFLANGVADAAAWKLIPSPSPGVTDNELFSVATVAAHDVWTVGDMTISGGVVQTLTEHWNGTQWSVVTSPNPGPFRNVLSGVTAISTSDVWAVGTFNNARDVPQTLTEHWNGTQWSVIPSPNVGHSDNFLNGVTAISPNDVLAVGQFRNGSGFFQTLTLHWNGKKWKVVTSPNVGTNSNVLSGVTAISPNDVWSVGNTTVSNGIFQTLTEHWNGTQWSIVKSPNPDMNNNVLNAVKAVSTSDVWAVEQTATLTLIEHWNGTQWSVVKSRSPGTNNLLRGVAAVSATDIWAVGVFFNASGVAQTLTLFHP